MSKPYLHYIKTSDDVAPKVDLSKAHLYGNEVNPIKDLPKARDFDSWKSTYRPGVSASIALPIGPVYPYGTPSSQVTTSPGDQFRGMYGVDLAENLRAKAYAWQQQHPNLQGKYTPVYSPDAWNRQIPVYGGATPTGFNAFFARVNDPTVFRSSRNPLASAIGSEYFINADPRYNVFNVPTDTNGDLSKLLKNKSTAAGLLDKALAYSTDRPDLIDHKQLGLKDVVSVHEATHALSPPGQLLSSPYSISTADLNKARLDRVRGQDAWGRQMDERLNERTLLESASDTVGLTELAKSQGMDVGAGPSEYGLSELEFPAHISEMKARYYKNTGVVPDMDTPEQRAAFLDFWQKTLQAEDIPMFYLKRYVPIINYLKNSSPEEVENTLRSIVDSRRQPYSHHAPRMA